MTERIGPIDKIFNAWNELDGVTQRVVLAACKSNLKPIEGAAVVVSHKARLRVPKVQQSDSTDGSQAKQKS